MDALLTGGCLCGGVRFEGVRSPAFRRLLSRHCTRCQRRTGTASSAQARVNGRALRIVHGEELVKGWRHPGVRPTVRVHVAYAAAWEPIPDDGLERFDEQLPS